MKVVVSYQCEFCKKSYKSSDSALKCEARCLGLTFEEYAIYTKLLTEEKNCYAISSMLKNEKTRKQAEEATKAVLEFQLKHKIIDNR